MQTTGVGTYVYASPEQLRKPNLIPYTSKSDIYSLGILLFELLCPFATGMERAKTLQSVREGVLPDDFVKKWPKEAMMVLWLTSEDPAARPTSKELLSFEVLERKRTMISLEFSTKVSSVLTTSSTSITSKPGQHQEIQTETTSISITTEAHCNQETCSRCEELERQNIEQRARIHLLEQILKKHHLYDQPWTDHQETPFKRPDTQLVWCINYQK